MYIFVYLHINLHVRLLYTFVLNEYTQYTKIYYLYKCIYCINICINVYTKYIRTKRAYKKYALFY